jgi:epoxyqueuosine reductase
MKTKLKALGRFIWDTYQHDLKVFVDTAPLMEKPAAQAVGHGWQGKHTNLVSRQFGSWLFLGELLLSVELPSDSPETDHCGQCRACLDICPTSAIPAPYRLEARRCISYLTIEHEGPIDRDLRPLLGNRIYGCDDCLAVCPWNKFAQEAREASLMPRPALNAPLLAELAALDDAAFRRQFAGTAIKRIGRDRFLRNVAYALGNSSRREAALPAVDRLLDDGSPLVRGAAVWALSRLDPDDFERRRQAAQEANADVRAEWSAAGIELR